jgi:TfoX/Sxy family transcriptional regulator of competence genes
MAFDERLAERIRKVLGPDASVVEKKMFGGIAFMRHGNMAVGIVGDDLMVRVGPDAWEKSLSLAHARVMDFTGKPMRGYVYVAAAGVDTAAKLRRWIERGLEFVDTLPPKVAKRKTSKKRKG